MWIIDLALDPKHPIAITFGDDDGRTVRVEVEDGGLITKAFERSGELLGRLDWDAEELFAQADARPDTPANIAQQMADAIQLDHLTDDQVDAIHDALDGKLD